MTDAGLGFSLAVLCSLSFGAYILPRKLSKLSVLDYQFWVAVAIAPAMLTVNLVAGSPLFISPLAVWIAISCGVLWTFGSMSYSAAVDYIGVTRSTPVKNLAPAFAAFYGIAVFHEYVASQPRELFLTIGGVVLMILAAFLIGRAGAHDYERAHAFDKSSTKEEKKRSFAKGVLYSMGAAFFYGAYSVPLKWLFQHDIGAFTACAWLGIGVLLSTVVVFAIKRKKLFPSFPGTREFGLAISAGGIWTSGQIVGALAMLYIPMSISWPVSNLGTLVAMAWGVFIFKEVHLEKHRYAVVASVVTYIVGLTFLAWAAPAGRV